MDYVLCATHPVAGVSRWHVNNMSSVETDFLTFNTVILNR